MEKMRAGGILVFGLAVLVNSIESVNSPQRMSPHSPESAKSPPRRSPHPPVGLDLKPYYDRGEKLSIISATCELHFDEHGYKELYYPDENYLPQKLAGEINFVVIGDTIVGQGFNNFIHPLLNERGNIVLIKGADRVEISPEEAEIHGVFRFYKVEFATPNYEHSAQPNCGHHVSG